MYFGLKEGESSRYEKVYNQVSNYLKDLNPAGFNDNVKKITTMLGYEFILPFRDYGH